MSFRSSNPTNSQATNIAQIFPSLLMTIAEAAALLPKGIPSIVISHFSHPRQGRVSAGNGWREGEYNPAAFPGNFVRRHCPGFGLAMYHHLRKKTCLQDVERPEWLRERTVLVFHGTVVWSNAWCRQVWKTCSQNLPTLHCGLLFQKWLESVRNSTSRYESWVSSSTTFGTISCRSGTAGAKKVELLP